MTMFDIGQITFIVVIVVGGLLLVLKEIVSEKKS